MGADLFDGDDCIDDLDSGEDASVQPGRKEAAKRPAQATPSLHVCR